MSALPTPPTGFALVAGRTAWHLGDLAADPSVSVCGLDGAPNDRRLPDLVCARCRYAVVSGSYRRRVRLAMERAERRRAERIAALGGPDQLLIDLDDTGRHITAAEFVDRELAEATP